MTKVGHKPAIAFEKWRFSIQTAADVNQLMLVVAAYLSGWDREELSRIPAGAAVPIRSTVELMARAVDLSRLELGFDEGAKSDPALLRELSLTIAFAASRMRYLQSLGIR
jgi:hypothetical protein